MNFPGVVIPEDSSWAEHLQLSHTTELKDLMGSSLIWPLREFFKNPGKNIRPRLVELGFRFSSLSDDEELSDEVQQKIKVASTIIEALHAGSIIVDDIQDESTVRRNSPTLHLKHGLPLALNAGNWLYFWALEQIRELKLPPQVSESLLFDCLGLLTRAHYGQALDVGVKINEIEQRRVRDVCLASMELKTGTLFSLALRLGIAICPSSSAHSSLTALGARLGVALQAYDDAGNFILPPKSEASKRHEDLKLRRPTWVWAQAAFFSSDEYKKFIFAIDMLPDEQRLNSWIDKNGFRELITKNAEELLASSMNEFQIRWSKSHPIAFRILIEIAQQLENSYVKP
jgi:geranylgeranyl pyrophosphate synthase